MLRTFTPVARGSTDVPSRRSTTRQSIPAGVERGMPGRVRQQQPQPFPLVVC